MRARRLFAEDATKREPALRAWVLRIGMRRLRMAGGWCDSLSAGERWRKFLQEKPFTPSISEKRACVSLKKLDKLFYEASWNTSFPMTCPSSSQKLR